MTLPYILIFSLFALAAGMLANRGWRNWLIFLGSLLAVYALQPATPIRHLDFWLPTLSLALCALGWAVTAPRPGGKLELSRASRISALLMAAVVLLIGLTRYVNPLCCLIPTRPPEIMQILAGLGLATLLIFALARLQSGGRLALGASILLILGLFLVLKTDLLAQAASAGLRLLNGQSPDLALSTDLRWLGFSYIAFRLLQTLRDRQTGRLPALGLQEYVSYVVFFPALAAGPIDRAERFARDLAGQKDTHHRVTETTEVIEASRKPLIQSVQNDLAANDSRFFATHAPHCIRRSAGEHPLQRANLDSRLFEGGKRIVLGLFKKFVLADTLALVALSNTNFSQVDSAFWMWVLLYAYALRIYFDFSGYTDVAIGIGRLVGIRLPENFDRPYLKPNLTAFWNSWHITLAQWFRTYVFNPLTRALRTAENPIPPYLIILAGQLATMALIGLWHGVTWNFLIWGVWHGVGLFVHNRWLEFSRRRSSKTTESVGAQGEPRTPLGCLRPHGVSNNQPGWSPRVTTVLSTFITFNYVALGWVWFALSLPSQSWAVMLKLFGL